MKGRKNNLSPFVGRIKFRPPCIGEGGRKGRITLPLRVLTMAISFKGVG